MASTGGSILEVTFNHSTLGNGSFKPMASEDSTFDSGGFINDDDLDRITGNGEAVYSKTNKRWVFEIVCANDMNVRNDTGETLPALAESDIEADWTISHINGTVWQGKAVLFSYADDLVVRALIVEKDFFKNSLDVVKGTTNPNRFETFFRYKRSSIVRVASTTAEAGFAFGLN